MTAITPASVREFAACQNLLYERAAWLAGATGSLTAMRAAQLMSEAADALEALADEIEQGE